MLHFESSFWIIKYDSRKSSINQSFTNCLLKATHLFLWNDINMFTNNKVQTCCGQTNQKESLGLMEVVQLFLHVIKVVY